MPSPSRRLPTVFLLALAPCLGAVPGPTGQAAAAGGPVTVTLRPLEGPPVRGGLVGIGPERGVVLLTDVGERAEPLARVLEVEVEGGATASLAGRAHLRAHLVDGSVLAGGLARASEDGIALAVPAVGEVALTFDQIRTLVAVPADADRCFEPESRTGTSEAGEGGDTAWLAGGDAVRGLVLAAGGDGITLETGRGAQRVVPWDALTVLELENDPLAGREGLVVEIETVEGSRLALAAAPTTEAADGSLALVGALACAPDRALRVALAGVRTVRPSGGAFVYACELPFESTFATPYDVTPGEAAAGGAEEAGPLEQAFLASWYGARVDRRPSGCPLRLAGRTLRHGFAVHARSTVSIALAKRYATFATLFGVDDEALEVARGGVVDARVLADGAVLWEARAVRAGEAPREIGPLDVGGVSTLVLEVDFGPELHVRDRATWGEPVLVKKSR